MQPRDQLPVLDAFTETEKRISTLQTGITLRLRKSPYYIIETTKSTDLPRYSDKYFTAVASHPVLKRKELHAPFFPIDIFDGYFNPRKKRKVAQPSTSTKMRMNLDELNDDGDEMEKSSDERSDAGSQAEAEDYDVDEEYDNDYAENYFDNGEGDDMDNLGDAGGGDDGGGGGDYD
ncbi:hypothetical protein HGRIS_011369 [Hohenbuehelia grisea]|uniref:DNA-directed RNA polymerase III subunit n=1 Tax=Hohenbuehelia grisea TaxID=104357 RepID=A0ABR3JW87_9AGAR